MTTGPDRRPAYVRYRTVAATLDGGSLACFPHRIHTSRRGDYTTNMGYVWFHGWSDRGGRGELGIGLRHPVDDGAGQYHPCSVATTPSIVMCRWMSRCPLAAIWTI